MILRILISGLLCGLLVCVSGCGGQPEGVDELRHLAEEEEARMIEIALDTQRAKEAQESYDPYTASLGWMTIKWNDNGDRPSIEMTSYDYESGEYRDRIYRDMGESAELFVEVILMFGDPPGLRLSATINPDTGEVVDVMTRGLKKLVN